MAQTARKGGQMFLTREKKILNMLLKNDKKYTTSQIAAELKVSPRTIKADIKKINQVLEKHSCVIQTKQGVGLWLNCDEEGEKYLKLALYEDKDAYISQDIRKYYIAAELLLYNEYTSMEAIANRLYVSKGTVVNDLNELERFWEKFGITFIKKVKYGIKTEGTETQIRRALVHALKRSTGTAGKLSLEKLQSQLEMVDINDLKEVIEETENRFHFVLTDVSFNEFLIQLAVLVERVENECFTDLETAEEQERREWFVSHFLRERISEKIELEIPDAELSYLIACLQGLRFQVPMVKVREWKQARSREPEMFDYMMELIRDIDGKYHLQLEEDEDLSVALFDHLECMVHRIQSKMYLQNPILDSVKKEMFYEYEIASYLISRFSTRYEIEATEDEIGYITFHIGASIERQKEKQKKQPRVTIVCMTGIGTSQFISVKLKRLFPDIVIERTISGNKIDELKPEDQDIVVSTVPVYSDTLDIVNVSPVLSDEDVRRIERHLNRNDAAAEKKAYSNVKNFLHEETTILNCDLKSKEEVIELLGGRMLRENYVDENYVASVFEREKLSETAVGKLVAIPHAFEGHIRKQCIGLLTLQKPITWGNEKVQIVFLLGLESKSENNFRGIFEDILDMTKDMKAIEQILKARKYSEIENLK